MEALELEETAQCHTSCCGSPVLESRAPDNRFCVFGHFTEAANWKVCFRKSKEQGADSRDDCVPSRQSICFPRVWSNPQAQWHLLLQWLPASSNFAQHSLESVGPPLGAEAETAALRGLPPPGSPQSSVNGFAHSRGDCSGQGPSNLTTCHLSVVPQCPCGSCRLASCADRGSLLFDKSLN